VGLVVLALQSGELVLLQSDHVEESVDLAFSLDLHVLVHFSDAGLAVVVRIVSERGRHNAGASARTRTV
jgi:hypothetical protein